MKARIIHNPQNGERARNLKHELDRQGITDFKIMPHITGHGAVRGINLAHKNCVRDAMMNGESEVLIFEDDIKFPAEDGFKYFLENKPDDFDIYLGGIYQGSILQGNRLDSFCGFHCYIMHERFFHTFLKLPENKNIDVACRGKGKFYVCNPFAAIQYSGFSYNAGREMDYSHLLTKRSIYGL